MFFFSGIHASFHQLRVIGPTIHRRLSGNYGWIFSVTNPVRPRYWGYKAASEEKFFQAVPSTLSRWIATSWLACATFYGRMKSWSGSESDRDNVHSCYKTVHSPKPHSCMIVSLATSNRAACFARQYGIIWILELLRYQGICKFKFNSLNSVSSYRNNPIHSQVQKLHSPKLL